MGKHKKRNKTNRNLSLHEYNYYFGIPHCHTAYSRGKGTPYEAFKYAKEKGLDYLITTDHSGFLDSKLLSGRKSLSKWDLTRRESRKYNKKHSSFCALYGYECKLKSIGDINILNSSSLLKGQIRNLEKLETLLNNNELLAVSINHPSGSIEKLKNISQFNKYITSIEVGNGSYPFKYRRYDKIYFRLLDKGWRLGAINGQDNHLANWGDSDNLTVVLAERFSPDSIIKAFRSRRTYSTESRSLKMNFSINNAIIGQNVTYENECELKIIIYAYDNKIPIVQLQLVTNNSRVIWESESTSTNGFYEFTLKGDRSQNWYVLKVIQEGDKQAISSPIFINYI